MTVPHALSPMRCAISINRWLSFAAPSLPLQFLGFYDHGTVGSVDRLPGEARDFTLKSAGLGLRFGVARHLSISFDYGWTLEKISGVSSDSRAHFSSTLSY